MRESPSLNSQFWFSRFSGASTPPCLISTRISATPEIGLKSKAAGSEGNTGTFAQSGSHTRQGTLGSTDSSNTCSDQTMLIISGCMISAFFRIYYVQTSSSTQVCSRLS